MAVNQLKAGAVLNYVIIALNALVGLLYTPFLIRSLGQSEYGLYSLVVPIVGYLTLLDFGFGNAVIRYTAKFRAEGNQQKQYEMWGMFLVLYCAIAVVAALAGLVLYFNIDNLFGATMTSDELWKAKILTIILVFNLAVTFPFSIFGGIITAYEDFIFQKVISIIRIILNTVVMIVLLQQGFKSIALVIVQTVFNILTMGLNVWYCRNKIKIKIVFGKYDWSLLREVVIYSFWIFLNAIMDKIYWSTGQFVLGAVSGTIAVSILAIAIHLEGMYMTFSTAISSVFLPRVSMMVAKGSNEREISDLFIRTGRIQYLVMSLILCGFIVFGRQFILIWAGEEYSESFIVSLMFFVALFIPLIQNLGITILQARNQMKFRSLLYIIIAGISLIFQVVLSKSLGVVGCAIAISGALLLGQGLLLNIYYSKVQKIAILEFWKQILKMSVAPAILTALSVIILQKITLNTIAGLMIGIMLFSILYAILLWVFSMNRSEKDLVMQAVNKLTRK